MLSSMDKTIDLLKNINGVSVSRREVDTIACLLSGKGVKSIALFLGVSPRTIETYVRAITFKFGCNSREGIIRFVEKSDQFSLLKNYYVYLLRQNYFKESLQKIALIAKHNKPVSVVLYKLVTEQQNYFLHQLANYLQLCGINLLIEEKAKLPILNDSVPAIGVICREEDNTDIPIVFLLQTNTLPLGISGETKEKEAAYINFGDFEKNLEKSPDSFYLLFFDVLKRILPEISLDSILLKIQNLGEDSSDQTKKDNQSPLKDSSSRKIVLSFPLQPKKALISGGIIGIILMIFFFLTLAFYYEPFKITRDSSSIRADLPIPHQKVLLDRAQILRKIENSFKNQESGIKCVTLVGTGGSGKTTLSRLYARSQNVPFVWEINAETKESLRNSFKDIAYVLSKTPEQKSDLELIQKISNATEQEKQLLFFVKQRLKEKSSWLLIYDNVESLSDMKNFLPEDQQVWGEGKILVTTRDRNSSNTGYINPDRVISIDELEPIDTFALCSKILYDSQSDQLTSSQQEDIRHFLQQIPAFPLDISMASYYIKNTQITFTQYLKRLQKFTKEFDQAQEFLLKKVNHYTKTRYGIVSASLEKIIEIHPDFKELLFLICLMNSQNIPVAFLESRKEPFVIEQLIYLLKKHAFITHQKLNQKESSLHTFSLHRSTQEAGLAFLKKIIEKTDQRDFIEKATKSISNLNGLTVDKEKPSLFFQGPITLRVCLLPHLLPFMKHIESLNFPAGWIEEIKGILLLTIGDTHYECFENMLLAQKYLQEFFSKQVYSKHLNQAALAITLRKLGIICINLGNLEEGIQYCQQSLNLCKTPQLSLLKSFNLKHIGLAYSKKNQFEKAISYSRQALCVLAHVAQPQRKEMEANIYEQIAGVYSRTYINQPEALQAKGYVLKALELLDAVCLFRENPAQHPKLSPYFIVKSRLALGIVYNRLGQYKKAIREGFLEAQYIIDHYMKEDCNFFINALIDLNFGEALLREGQLKEAEKKLTSSINIAQKILGSSSQCVCHAKVLRTETLFRLGKINSAYTDCTAILGMNSQYSDSHDALVHLTAFYHAAVIADAQRKYQEVDQCLLTFLTKAQTFCELFLSKSDYESLLSRGAFESIRNNEQPLKRSFQKSASILAIIYGTSHPFIREYVIKKI